MRFPPANMQLRRAQLVLMLAILVPTILMTSIGIVLLAVGSTTTTLLFADLQHTANHSWLPPRSGSNPFYFVVKCSVVLLAASLTLRSVLDMLAPPDRAGGGA